MSSPFQPDMTFRARLSPERPWRDCLWMGIAWSATWTLVVTIAGLSEIRSDLWRGGVWSSAGYATGFAAITAISFALSGLLGGSVLGAALAFTGDDTRAARVSHAVIGAGAGTASILFALATHRHFPRPWIPELTVPFYALVGAALASSITAALHTRHRTERDRLMRDIDAARPDRLQGEAAKMLEHREKKTEQA